MIFFTERQLLSLCPLSTLRGPKSKSFTIVPMIPFKASELKKLPKHKYQMFKVLINKNSKQVIKLEGYNKNCEQYLLWQNQVMSIINSLNVKKYNEKINLINQLIEGNLRNKFVTAKSKTAKQITQLADANKLEIIKDK